MDEVYLYYEGLMALPTPPEPEDAQFFAEAYEALRAYVLASYPGGDEGLRGAADLAHALRAHADDFALQAWDRDWIALQEGGLRMQLDCVEEAEGVLVEALRASSAPQRTAELSIVGAQVAQLRHFYDEAHARLAAAEQALATLPDSFTKTDLEAQHAGARVRLLQEIGLADRARDPLAFELECARQLFTKHNDRLRLDDALLDQVAQFQADVEHAQVLELLRPQNAELPPPGSFAAWRLYLREATSRAELELLGSPPADRNERDPVAMYRSALASGALLRFDQQYAREWLVSTLLDRGETEAAASELAALHRAPKPAGCSTPRFVDARVVLETRLALARKDVAAFPDLRRRAASEWRAFLERWKPLARNSELAPLYFEEVGKLVRGLIDLHLALDGQERGAENALAELVLGQGVGSMAQALTAPAPDLAELRALLGADEVALLHVPVREEGRVFVFTRDEVSVHPLPGLPAIQGARRRLARALDSALHEENGAAWDEFERECAALCALLLPGEVGRRVARASALALVAPENVGYVPFELLPGAEGVALGLTHEVRYLPSLTVAAALARRRAARAEAATEAPELALFLADEPGAVSGAPLARLPIDTSRIEGLAAPFTRTLPPISGPTADRQGLATLLEQAPRTLFVLAHGHVDPDLARPVSLVLAGTDPLFGAGAAEALAFPGLVTLATCGAWEGPRRRGDDGRAHLPNALLLAGAETVVAAESPLLLEPALALFTQFHEHLAHGLTPSAALLEARRASAKALTRRERNLALLVHVIGLGDEPVAPRLARTGPAYSPAVAPPAAALEERTGPTKSGSGPGGLRYLVPIAGVVLLALAIALGKRRR